MRETINGGTSLTAQLTPMLDLNGTEVFRYEEFAQEVKVPVKLKCQIADMWRKLI